MTRAALAENCRAMLEVKVPMRDGVSLATTVYLPVEEGQYPAVLVRTAYNRVGLCDTFFPQHGMALIVQDCRGRYASEGEWYPFVHEAQDGYDTLEWIAGQPWCNGRMGMYGPSYLAATQFYAALSGSEHLAALAPSFMSGDCWKRGYYCDGAFSLGLTWSWLCFECASRTSVASCMPQFDVRNLLRSRPLLELDENSGAGKVSFYRDYLRHGRYDEFWEELSLQGNYERFTMPVLLVGGWYDNYAAEAARNFQQMRRYAPSERIRRSHRLLLGPWTHGINSETVLGELDFGEEALRQNDATQRWLDCILHDRDPMEFQEAPVCIFVMGANRWRDEAGWPLERAKLVEWRLHGGGVLSTEQPSHSDPSRYSYDPADPVPTLGGNHSIGPYNPGLYELALPGPYDQQPVEERHDVLTYTSAPLEGDLEVTGPVKVYLYASSSARDTDFVARLTDVYPDGRSINITEGIIRARFRESVWGGPKLLQPFQPYEFVIDLQVTSNLFRKGHRLRVDITSSSFPLWAPNLNTGNDPATDTEAEVAEQAIYHDPDHPSRIELPVVE